MNKPTLALVAALAVGSTFPGLVGADKMHAMTPAEREKKLDKIASELDLTQDQKNKVRNINDAKYQQMVQLHQKADNEIRAVLMPEQQAKFDKMKEKNN